MEVNNQTPHHDPHTFPFLQIGLYILSAIAGFVSQLPELFKAAYIFLAPIVQLASIVSFVLASLLTLKNLRKKDG